jgi:hypothetical protein
MELFPPSYSPERNKWEETECDEVIQNITMDIHVHSHQRLGRINIFKVYTCQDFLHLSFNNKKIQNND